MSNPEIIKSTSKTIPIELFICFFRKIYFYQIKILSTKKHYNLFSIKSLLFVKFQ